MATQMAKFFSTTRRLGDFLANRPNLDLRDAISLAQRLVQENVLELAVCWDSGAGETASYVTYNLPSQEELDYGVIDCLAFGFPYVRSRFEKSIIPLVVEGEIGSAFLVEGSKLLTARHCLACSPGPTASVKLIGQASG